MLHLSILDIGNCFLFKYKPVWKLPPHERWALVFQYAGNPSRKELIHQIINLDKNCERAVLKMATWSPEVLAYIRETREIGYELEKNQWKYDIRKQAIMEKIVRLTLRKLSKGLTTTEIAEIMEEDEYLIQSILNLKQDYPDWSIEQIAEQILKTFDNVIPYEYT